MKIKVTGLTLSQLTHAYGWFNTCGTNTGKAYTCSTLQKVFNAEIIDPTPEQEADIRSFFKLFISNKPEAALTIE